VRRQLGRGVLGGILILAAPLCGCGRSSTADHATAAATAPAVTVAAAALKSVTPAGTFVGRVQAVNTVNLVSRVEGFLQKRAFTEGRPRGRGACISVDGKIFRQILSENPNRMYDVF
jgi:membrane fusion protein, multidrug efflux system